MSTVNSQIKMLHLAFRRGQLLSKSEQLTPQSSNLSQREVSGKQYLCLRLPSASSGVSLLQSAQSCHFSLLVFESNLLIAGKVIWWWRCLPQKAHFLALIVKSTTELLPAQGNRRGKKKQTKGVTISKRSDDKKTRMWRLPKKCVYYL